MGDPIAQSGTGFGTIAYGEGAQEVLFGPLQKVKITLVPHYDSTERTAMYNTYQLQVSAMILSGSETESAITMEAIQERLTTPGLRLRIEGQGFHTGIDTGKGKATPDLAWGAKPRLLNCVPWGGGIAWQIIWTVEFSILSRCNVPAGKIIGFTSDATYTVDDRGFSVRTMTGTMTIAQQFNSNNRLKNFNIERAFKTIKFFVPPGMKRKSFTRHIQPDKSKMDFTVVDEEPHNLPFPIGIINARMPYSFGNAVPLGFTQWNVSIAAEFEVAQGYPPFVAAERFFAILFSMISKLRAIPSVGGEGGGGGSNLSTVVPAKITIKRDMFSRTTNFSVTLSMFACLKDVIKTSGIFDPVPNTEFSQWISSLDAVGLSSPYGRSGLQYTVGSDHIIDVCGSSQNIRIGDDELSRFEPTGDQAILLDCGVTEATSYLKYETFITAFRQQDETQHSLAVKNEGVDSSKVQVNQNSITLAPAKAAPKSGGSPASQAKDTQFTQYRGSASNLVLLQCVSYRLKFHPEVPRLVSVGGVKVQEVKSNNKVEAVESIFGCTLYRGTFAILYRANGDLKELSAPKSGNSTICQEVGIDVTGQSGGR